MINDLVDSYENSKEDALWVKAKLADLEDRSRLNNVKLLGVPESIPPQGLQKFALDLISTLLPGLSPVEIIIDHIYRIPKPQHLADTIPSDVLMKINLFPVKEQLLFKVRQLPNLPAPYEGLQLYADL